MKLMISGYGTKPMNTVCSYSLDKEGIIKSGWEDSVQNASFVCQGDDYLFTITEEKDYAVVYLYEQVEDGFQLLDQRRIDGGYLCHIAYSTKNKALFGACYETGMVVSIRVENRSFGEMLFQEVQLGDQTDAITRAHCVLLNQDENELAVMNIALDRIYYYRIVEGSLLLKRILEVPKGSGPRHAIFSKEEHYMYVITEYSNEILVYEKENLIQRISTLDQNFSGSSNCSTLCFSKDGTYLYAANRGADTIALFTVSQEDGSLTREGEYDCGGRHPRHMILDQSGRYLIICNQYSDNVVIFELNQKTGALVNKVISIPFVTPSGVIEWNEAFN